MAYAASLENITIPISHPEFDMEQTTIPHNE
jgi:hypothetical protein